MKKARLAKVSIITAFLSLFFFSHSAYAGSSISIANSDSTIAFDKVQPTSSGTITTAMDTITVTTDCSAGYNIYISGVNGGSTSLVNNTANSNNEIGTLSGTTIGGTSLALQNNTWGLNTINDGTYYGLSAYADATDHAIYSGTSNSISIYYGAKVTNSLVPGKYSGQILYTAAVNTSCLEYTLQFDTNGATSSTLTSQTRSINDLIDLSTISSASVISKTGYHLTGWKDQDDNSYGITGTVDVNPTDTTPVTLTAQWAANTYTIKYSGYDAPSCSNTVHPTATTGCKMADGNIWILGYNGNAIAWNNAFSNATGANNHNATVNTSYDGVAICPAGYSFPKVTDYDNLLIAYGGQSYAQARSGYYSDSLRYALGKSENITYWSSTEMESDKAYVMNIFDRRSYTVTYGTKTGTAYVMCYKSPPSSPSSITGSTEDQTEQAYDTDITLRANGYTVEGYDFLGWSLDPFATTASYSANTSYTVSTLANTTNTQNTNGANITLYAVWQKSLYTFEYNANGGSGSVSSQSNMSYGDNVRLRSNSFSRSNYTFQGWSLSNTWKSSYSANTSYTVSDIVSAAGKSTAGSATITLYAVWKYTGTPSRNSACSTTVHPTVDTACYMNDGRWWVRGNSGYSIKWTDLCTSSENCITSTVCPSGYSLPNLSVYNNLLIAYGGSAYGDGGYALWNSNFDVIGVWASWSSTQGRILNVGNAFAATYNTFSTSSAFPIRCYR